ncbi:guanylyl cyclase-activating protein 1 [Callorhinchus milii]|nr:guanylyl cyclase-activating protein 1 [Callorhinchus milii]|eukprot:gi/632956533/ref/XP_007894003.1/ PREDICTED: guanylyl cyclase-activating protein 3 [Callorhinchus milii]
MGASGSCSADDLNTTEIHYWYNKFMKECPSGQLCLHEFKAILGLQGMNEEATSYVNQLFITFDMNKDGFIDFLEYVAAISLVLRGKLDQKLKWYFKLYDADGNGRIDKEELLSIIKAVRAINRANYDISPEDFTEMLFRRIDINGDGELTLEEFMNGVENDEELMDMITKSLDLTNVLKVIERGRRHSV